jgi:hypothetical protein
MLVHVERAVGVVGAHVRGVVTHEGGSVTVTEIFLTRNARSLGRSTKWQRHEANVEIGCDIPEPHIGMQRTFLDGTRHGPFHVR